MRDELKTELESALEEGHRDRAPDLGWVVARGRRLRALRWVAITLSLVVIVGVASTGLGALSINRKSTGLAPGGDSGSKKSSSSARTDSKGRIVEQMTQQEQAEVFAFRALAATGLMNPYGKRSYNFTYEDDTTRTSNGWRVGFAASDCEPEQTGESYSFTCRGLSGDDPELGNAITDTWITVALGQGDWRVVKVEGNMLDGEVERVLGYEMPQRDEPSHWEFPAVAIWPMNGETAVEMMALWVGPYPTSAPGSECAMQGITADGEIFGERSRFFEKPPRRPFDRAGWIRATSVESSPDLARMVVKCRQSGS